MHQQLKPFLANPPEPMVESQYVGYEIKQNEAFAIVIVSRSFEGMAYAEKLALPFHLHLWRWSENVLVPRNLAGWWFWKSGEGLNGLGPWKGWLT